MASERPTFGTYVFMDLETTGLPGVGERPRIVEISMVAVQCKVLSEKILSVPRVLDKLVICLNPCNKPMDQQAAMITGLYNDELEDLTVFNEDTVTILRLFLSRLPAPVCMLAHNGDRFDFPMLKMELDKISQCLPADLFCVDSLKGLRFVELGYSEYRKADVQDVSHQRNANTNNIHQNNEITPVKTSETTPSHLTSRCAPNDNPPPAPRKKRNLSGTRNVGVIKSARRKLLQGEELHCDGTAEADSRQSQSFSQTPPSVAKQQTGLPPRKLTFEGESKSEFVLDQTAAIRVQDTDAKASHNNVSSDEELLQFPSELLDDFIENETLCSVQCQTNSVQEGNNSDQTNHPGTNSDQPNHPGNNCDQTNHTSNNSDQTNHPCEFTDSLPDEDLIAVVEEVSNDNCQNINADSQKLPTVSALDEGSDQTKGGNPAATFSQSPNQVPSSETYIAQLTPTKHRDSQNIDQSVSSEKAAKNQANEIKASQVTISANQNENFSTCARSLAITPRYRSFKLPDIYKRHFGHFPEVSHAAEDDCITLLKIVQSCVSKFAPWVEQNAVLFSEITKMY